MLARMDSTYDLLVIGAGINGAGIARDAAGRGLRVLLVERDGRSLFVTVRPANS